MNWNIFKSGIANLIKYQSSTLNCIAHLLEKIMQLTGILNGVFYKGGGDTQILVFGTICN